MNSQSLGSAIYLSNVDDYSELSQACVNPIFAPNISPSKSNLGHSSERPTLHLVTPTIQQSQSGARSRRGRTRTDIRSSLINVTGDDENSQLSIEAAARTMIYGTELAEPVSSSMNSSNVGDIVTATLADCLACSGCITTAETIILQEQHSLDRLKDHLFLQTPTKTPTVLTISPASLADLCRFLLTPEMHESKYEETSSTPTTTSDQSSTLKREQILLQLTTVLFRYLNIRAVMDCAVTLHTTLQIAAEEFCEAYQNNKCTPQHKSILIPSDEMYEQQLLPSVALSSEQSQYWIPVVENTMITI